MTLGILRGHIFSVLSYPTFKVSALITYDSDGSCLVAAILSSHGIKYVVLNERGIESELAGNRLHGLPGSLPESLQGSQVPQEKIAQYLSKIAKAARQAATTINLEPIWEKLQSSTKDFTNGEIAALLRATPGDISLEEYLAARFALVTDGTYFKRRAESFSPRPAEIVAQLRHASDERRNKELRRQETVAFFTARLSNPTLPVPQPLWEPIEALEDIAAETPHLENSVRKEAFDLVGLLATPLKLDQTKAKEAQALSALQKVGLVKWGTNPALIRYRPPIFFTPEAEQAALQTQVPSSLTECLAVDQKIRRDLTDLEVITIDDQSTKDMDDGLSLERTAKGYRLGIHISDVASIIPHQGPLDEEAGYRATSIYLPELTIHMLPDEISKNRASLVEGQTRPCISCFYELSRDGSIISSEIIPTLIRSHRRLSYPEVDQLIERQDEQVRELYDFAMHFEAARMADGGFKVDKREIAVTLDGEQHLTLVEIDEQGPARSLVGEMMILANITLAQYAVKHSLPFVYRSQEAAADNAETRSDAVPAGPAHDYAIRTQLKRSLVSLQPGSHATLGTKVYAQTTSPIRRYLDLCNQRQILWHLRTGSALYTREQMQKIIEDVEVSLRRSIQLTKDSKRFWTLKYLEQKPGKGGVIRATVLRVDMKLPLVELDEVFMPTLAHLQSQVKPGDEVQLRIANLDPWRDILKLEQV